MNSLRELSHLLPELLIAAGFVLVLVVDLATAGTRRRKTMLLLVTLGILAVTLTAALQASAQPQEVFLGQLAIDPLGHFFRLLFLATTATVVCASALSTELPQDNLGEYLALLLAMTLGLCLMASAADLLTAYLGLELVSIVGYALAGFRLHDRRASEAALKYVVYGGAASGLMLFGISLLYGLLGSTKLAPLHDLLHLWLLHLWHASQGGAEAAFPWMLATAFALLFVGIGFKIAAVPLHMWAPDVYEGAPTPFAGFLSVGPKAAGFALLVRFLLAAFVAPGTRGGFATDFAGMMHPGTTLPISGFIGVFAALTMTVGNIAALPQTNVKRLLAYSSIAHAGYLLMGVSVFSSSGLHAVLLYLVIYYVMNLGAFVVCQAVRDRWGGEHLQHFSGLGYREPLLAVCMTVFLLSLTGLPPMAGFVGKFYLFAAVLERGGSWFVLLAIVGVLNSAVSLYYYMQVVRAMFLREAKTPHQNAIGWGYRTIALALAIPTVGLCVQWGGLSRAAHGALDICRGQNAGPQPQTAEAAKMTPWSDTP